MGMNPDTNRFEMLKQNKKIAEKIKELYKNNESFKASATYKYLTEPDTCKLVRSDGSPVPKHWTVFSTGEEVVIKGYTFKVAYIGETAILFEPVGPVIVGEED